MCEKYNGWANYETWNVKLWLDNEQGTQEDMLDLARGYDEGEAWELGNAIESYVTEELPDMLGIDIDNLPLMFGDMLSASLRAVDWYEIAEAYLQEVGNA